MKLVSSLVLLITFSLVLAEPIKRAKEPSLSPDGSHIAFSWQNDLWLVPSGGGIAQRLTVNPGVDMIPRWYPDGTRIAFSSNRFGANDIFSMKADGTDLRRHTMDSATELLYSVARDGQRMFGWTSGWGRSNLFVTGPGGDPVRLTDHPLETSYHPAVSPDGGAVAYVLGAASGGWRNPGRRGTDTGEIWIAQGPAPLTTHRQLTRNEFHDAFPLWAPDGTLVFMSNRSGSPNLWRMRADGSGARQLTDHASGTMRWPHMSANGRFVVYQLDAEVMLYDVQADRSTRVLIDVPDDQVVNPTLDLNLNTGAQEIVVAPDGKRAVLAVRGDLFLIPERGGTTRRLTSSQAWDGQAVWLDARRVLFVSGRSGKRELWTVDLDGKESRFATDARDLTLPALSPDGKTLAFHRGDREIVAMPVSGGAMRVVARGGFPGAFQGDSAFTWSPDSKWLAFADRTERGANISLVELATGTATRVARAARAAGQPLWLPNGRGVFYATAEFGDSDIALVDLLPPDVTFSEDDLDAIDAERPRPGPVEVRVDPRQIEYRVRRLTNGDASPLLATPDSRAIWANVGGQLSAVPVAGGAATPVAGVQGAVSWLTLGSGKAYFLSQGRASALTLSNGSIAAIPFSAQLTVDRKAEDLALFDEIWWAMDRIYYDPNHHGKNWSALRQKYAAIVPFAFDRSDFYDLMLEMVEELDSSHLGSTSPGPTQAVPSSETTAFLGAEWDPARMLAGEYVVKSVIPLSPVDQGATRLLPGDRLLQVDGVAVTGQSLAAQLRNKSGRRVRLTVQRDGKEMSLAVRAGSPAGATSLLYERFVAERRSEVDRLSNGRFTYFHIQGMNGSSTERLFREMRVHAEGKQGAIFDVRWNGGGNTANRILAAIRTEPWLIRRFRSNPDVRMTEEMFRGEALEMPMALLTNQHSYSNAESFSEGFRQMKLGPIIGEATGGNVLTISSPYALWDGGSVQIPFIQVLTVAGESLEGIGRRVDVDVRYDPNAWLQGRDNQLERAVQELNRRVR